MRCMRLTACVCTCMWERERDVCACAIYKIKCQMLDLLIIYHRHAVVLLYCIIRDIRNLFCCISYLADLYLLYRTMMSLKSHFSLLRDHLLAILAPLNRDSIDLEDMTNQLGDDVLSQLDNPGTLSKIFELVNQYLTWIEPTGSGRSKESGSSEEEEMDEEDREDKVSAHL